MILFSPEGSVQSVYHWDTAGGYAGYRITSPVFLMIGKWERTGIASTGPPVRSNAEDGLHNWQDASNLWMAIGPDNGLVTTAEVNALATNPAGLAVPADPYNISDPSTYPYPVPADPTSATDPAQLARQMYSSRAYAREAQISKRSTPRMIATLKIQRRTRFRRPTTCRGIRLHRVTLTPDPRPLNPGLSSLRRGVSLLEVLIAVFILTFGLLSVAMVIPAGRALMVEASKSDRSAACGRAALNDIQVREWHKPSKYRQKWGPLGIGYRSAIVNSGQYKRCCRRQLPNLLRWRHSKPHEQRTDLRRNLLRRSLLHGLLQQRYPRFHPTFSLLGIPLARNRLA